MDDLSLPQQDNNRTQAVKREKSHTDSLEREKKRVKFSFNYSECSSSLIPKYQITYGFVNNRCQPVPSKVEKGILKKFRITNTEKSSKDVDSCKDVVKDVPREDTFTKENMLKERNENPKQIVPKNSKEKLLSNKPDTVQNEIIVKQKIIIKKSPSSSKPRVNPTMSELKPQIYPKTERKGSLKLRTSKSKNINLKKESNDEDSKIENKEKTSENVKENKQISKRSPSTQGKESVPRTKRALQRMNDPQKSENGDKKLKTEHHVPNISISRPSLTRSVSAAAALCRKVKPQIQNKSEKKDEHSPPKSWSLKKYRDEISGRKNGAQKRYVSKLEEMRKQIEEQQREIASLNQRLKDQKDQNPNLKSLSQLSASVPTVYNPAKGENQSVYNPAKEEDQSQSTTDLLLDQNEETTPQLRSLNHLPTDVDCFTRTNKELDTSPTMSAKVDDSKCKSLDVINMKPILSKGKSTSFHYSSLISLTGTKRETELAEENELLRAELQETRDHAELLEFRILEFTEGIQRATNVVNTTCDQSTNTCADDVTSPPPISEDLSLPLSVDSGLELSVDFINKSRLSEYRKSLSRLEEASSYSDPSSVHHLSTLLDYISTLSNGSHYEMNMSPRSPSQKKMNISSSALEDHTSLEILGENDLAMLATKLQESLTNPKIQEELLEETIHKLRVINASLSRLYSKVNFLSHENKELQEALNVLHESHETRTEASGTESELVNGKSPSLHSDLSDSECDDTTRHTKARIEASVSFQESGIFESSCEMVNAITQTIQENDDCLPAATEGEKVTLAKIEYDSIVSTERSLQREIEILQFEKDQLSQQCNGLEQKLQQKNTKESDTAEVLRAQVRLLEERLQITDKQRRLYFDEKCELEEAENDARLLSQRLESQLEAAREMESLLSASLSQEQEFCRELQRRVREMHAIDKGRRMHEEILEKESQFCRRREEALMVANNSQKSQLTFTLYGLILAQFWRRFAARNSKAVIPYSSILDSSPVAELSQFSVDASFVPLFPCENECEKCLNCELDKSIREVQFSDVFTQTNEYDTTEEDMVTFVDENSSNETQRKLFREETLSEREEYYLTQIETLQTERKTMREDYENEQSILYEQLQNVKTDIESLQQSLEESQGEKSKLLHKLEEAQSVINNSEIQLEKQAKELRKEFNKSLEVYQQEQKAMQEEYEERIVELRKHIEIHEQRFGALLQQYAVLQHELEPYFQGASDVDEYSSDGGGGTGNKIITTKDLLLAVRELVRSEALNKQKLIELEKKESAYRETINEADRIMSNHVTLYTRRIEELEANVEQKTLRIKQLESSEERLRNTMKNNWKSSSEGTRITELLDRLIETENSELNLKERVWNLERNGKELQIKFAEAEKAQENLRSELRDQEELVQKLMTLSQENNALTAQLQEAHEAARRACDIQQSENYLKNRVDEMEVNENSLRESLNESERIYKQRERKFKDQVSSMEGEISVLRGQLEVSMAEADQAKEVENSLRHQIDNYKSQIQHLEKDLKESSSENICHETQHRSEVTKLRSQLKLANTQLTDIDSLNGELKQQLEAAESAVKEVALQLEERSKRYENEVLSLNLQLAHNESKIEEYEVQMQNHSHRTIARELDYLATSPLVNLQKALHAFIKNIQNCQTCLENNQNSNLQTLTDCLKTLNEVINGRISQSDSESEDFETTRIENLANDLTTESPSTLLQEGSNGNTSGEGETSSVYSLTLTNDSGTDGGDRTSLKSLPEAPPRPRRDARKKRKLRKSVKNEGSLLDELEESTTVENGSFYGKLPSSVAALEELEERVRELEEVIAKKDEELRLADGEANDLQNRLMEEDEKLNEKSDEANKSKDALNALHQQLLLTVEEYEKARQRLEADHKVNMKELSKKMEKLTDDIRRLSKKAHLKDKIIDILIKQLRSLLRASSTIIILNEFKQLSRDFLKEENQNQTLETDLEIVDFDVDKVCQFLERPVEENEVSADLESNHSTQFDVLSQSLPSLTSVDSSKIIKIDSTKLSKKSLSSSDSDTSKRFTMPKEINSKACFTPRNLRNLPGNLRNLSPLDQMKSRIPRLRPLSSISLKHDDYSMQPELPPQPIFRQNHSPAPEGSVKPSEGKQELKPLAKVVPKQRPMAKVTPKPKNSMGDISKHLSDARKIKRMVTGLAPLSASVDCSAAPEFNSQPILPTPSCVPRPTDLRITRRVGIDGAVIAWKPLEHDCVSGFQVIVGGRVVQQVRSPHRTKALVTGLPFPSSFTIGLVTVAQDGRCSTPAVVSYDKPTAYKTRASTKPSHATSINNNNLTPRRALPTCL